MDPNYLLICTVLLSSLLHTSISTFTPTTSYFLNCGGPATTLTSDNPSRLFTTDSPFLSSPNSISLPASNGATTPISYLTDSAFLYASARVLIDRITYRFPLNSTGTHVLRLHFFSFSPDLSSARFNVTALKRFLLLGDFSVPPSSSPVIKEYLLWVDSGEELEVTFIPNSDHLSIAFVNAIEVFTAPSGLIRDENMYGLNIEQLTHQALETVYRLNVGGLLVTPANDTLWRTWSPDDEFLVWDAASKEVDAPGKVNYQPNIGLTEEVAPDSVYNSARISNFDYRLGPEDFNVTWSFSLKPKSTYFFRLHFCDFFSSAIDSTSIFNVYVGSIAVLDMRSSHFTSQLSQAFYTSFGVVTSGDGFVNISIGLSTDIIHRYANENAYLNGMEIFKVNNSVGSLNGTFNYDYTDKVHKNMKRVWIIIITVGGGLVLCLCIVFIASKKYSRPGNASSVSVVNSLEGSTPSGIPMLAIKFATNDFDEKLIIGRGGFGKVYKGVLPDGTVVAIKRGAVGSRQGNPEFQTEINILSKIRHQHLVSLVGYCSEENEKILVYEYMAKGPLKDYLHGSPDKPCLSWKQRLEICIGVARGLHYLHTGFKHAIIHRDVKSTNILLDASYSAKVSDFGLSKLGPSYNKTYVTTNVKGTFGYLDPQYFKTMQLTDKSDVYSFGVLLFEVLSGRPVIEQDGIEEHHNIVEWALRWKNIGELEKIVDPRIVGNVDRNSLMKFAEIAEKCVAECVDDRPMFGDVLWNLEHALQLQVTVDERTATGDREVNRNNCIGHSGATAGSIFSELLDLEAR